MSKVYPAGPASQVPCIAELLAKTGLICSAPIIPVLAGPAWLYALYPWVDFSELRTLFLRVLHPWTVNLRTKHIIEHGMENQPNGTDIIFESMSAKAVNFRFLSSHLHKSTQLCITVSYSGQQYCNGMTMWGIRHLRDRTGDLPESNLKAYFTSGPLIKGALRRKFYRYQNSLHHSVT